MPGMAMHLLIALFLLATPGIAWAEDAPRLALGLRTVRVAAGEFVVVPGEDRIFSGNNATGLPLIEYAFHERWSVGLVGGVGGSWNSAAELRTFVIVEPSVRFRFASYLSSGPWLGIAVPFWRLTSSTGSGDAEELQFGGDLLAGFTYRTPFALTFDFGLGVGSFGRWARTRDGTFSLEVQPFVSGSGLRAMSTIGWSL